MNTSPQLLTVKVEKLVYGGDALGRVVDSQGAPEGQAVFIRHALPGEIITARLLEKKPHYFRAEVVKILEPSPERIIPRCIHFGLCGGCHYQHLPYPKQLQAKASILGDQLSRIGKISAPPIDRVVPSPSEWNYRNHVQFHLTPDGAPGYMDVSGANILPISECHLPEDRLITAWHALNFPPGVKTDRVSFRAGDEEMIQVGVQSRNSQVTLEKTGLPVSMLQITDGEVRHKTGEETLHLRVKDRSFRVSPRSFFQVNTAMVGKMVANLREFLPVNPSTSLLDVYCGVGLFSAFFAGSVQNVTGVELSTAACEDFKHNLQEFNNVDLHQGKAEEVLPGLKVKPEAAVVDPPRVGIDKTALEALLALGLKRMVYISCDPATLARDAAHILTTGYQMKQVALFDLFPQTFHIESITLFEK